MTIPDRAALLLAPAKEHADNLLAQATSSVTAIDVLTTKDVTATLREMEREVRAAKKAKATDLALSRIVDKLEQLQPGEGNLDTLTRTAVALDPDKEQAGSTQVAVQVVFRQEGR